MKLLICLSVLFCLVVLATANSKCHRCEILAHNIELYTKSHRSSSLFGFEELIAKLCLRISEPNEKKRCIKDLDSVSSLWNAIQEGDSVREACESSGYCEEHYPLDWHLDHKDYNKFLEFKVKYGKKYDPEEDKIRAKFFLHNLKHIDELNKFAHQRKSSAKFGVNKFADYSRIEFKTRVLSKVEAKVDPYAKVAPEYNEEKLKALPSSFDWRPKGAVTPVKNQGQCGSCWSFSATGNMEGQWFLAGHKLVGLSEQNLVDCDHECMIYDGQKSCDQGCNGGLQPNAFTYVIKNKGIDSEASYPYQAVDGTCKFNRNNVAATITSYTMVSKNETQMAAYLVDHGPLAIAADAVEWQFYIDGVFDFPCGTSLDHGILITGYGVEKDILGTYPYWWIKNSWGADWGINGYMKLERGDGECGCNLFVSSSIV